MASSALALQRRSSIEDVGGEHRSSIQDLGGEQRSSIEDFGGEHRSRIDVVSVQLQKPALKNQVKT